MLKILHYADMQIEIRTSGINAQRLTEFNHDFTQLEKNIKSHKPDIVIIAGDIFEFHLANGEEQKIFATHLRNILDHTKRLIIIPGNHDVRQKGVALDNIGEKQNISDSIEPIVISIGSDKISYYKDTGLYKDNTFDITWAVWSQWTKHSMSEPKPEYSPWVNNEVVDNCIELFHDPIKGALDFSGKVDKTFESYNISLSSFQANTIIAGDIHAPDIIWFGENKDRLFTYSSSTTQRNFGEGDYYQNFKRTIKGNDKHGFNVIMYDDKKHLAESCEFHELDHIVSRHTIYIDDDFDYDRIEDLKLDYTTDLNLIKIVCQVGLKKFIDNEQNLVEHFKNNYNCHVSSDYAKDVLSVDIDEDAFSDLSQVIDKDKILAISKTYINTIVDKSTTIDKEDKETSKDYIYKIFEKQLNETELTKSSQNISLNRAIIHGFMPFPGKVDLDFKNNEITQIIGTNGIGKTKLFDFIKWIWTDRISAIQNDRNKKFNYSFYFNDSSENDSVYGELYFHVNNVEHRLTKKLTRAWKNKKKDIRNTEWIDLLSGTPKVEMTISSETFSSDNTGEVQEYLNSLMTYSDFAFIFANNTSLDAFSSMSVDQLSDIFLSVLGIDVTTTIIETYEDLKETELFKLTKPNITIDVAIDKIKESKEELESLIEMRKLDIDNKEEIERSVIELRKKINDMREKIHQVEKPEFYLKEIELIEYKIYKLNKEQDLIKEARILLNNKSNNDLEFVKEELSSLEKSSIELNEFKREHETSVIYKKSEYDFSVEKTKTLVLEVKEEVQIEIAQSEKDLVILNNKLNETNNEINKGVLDLHDNIREKQNKYDINIKELEDKLNEKNKEIDSLNETKRVSNYNIIDIDHKVNRLNDDIKNSLEGTNCPTCGVEKKEEAITKIKSAIVILNKKIDLLNSDKENELTKISEIDEMLSKIDIENIKIDIKDIKDKKDSYNKFFNCDLEDINGEFEEQVEKLKKLYITFEELNDEIFLLKNKIDEFNSSVKERVKNDERVLLSISKVKLLKESIEPLENKIEDYSKQIEEKKREIEEKSNLISEIENIGREIAANIEEHNLLMESILKQRDLLASNNGLLEKSKSNVILYSEIKTNEDTLSLIESDLNRAINLISKHNAKEIVINKNIDDLNLLIEDIRRYKLIDSSLKLYKRMLGKNGLPQYIFSHIIPLINKRLNDSLSNVDFRLIFDSDTLELRFIDLTNNISRPVQFLSGMQQTVVGLSIVNVLRILNHSKKFDILMIDEISGKLNDGSQLSYEAKNYQQIVQSFIESISKNSRVFIVDHILDFSGVSTGIIEVQPCDGGATIVSY